MIAVGLLAMACEPKPYIPQPPQGTADHTVIMYLAGNNNLDSYLKANIEDVISSVDASTPSDNGRIVIYYRPRPAVSDPMLLQVYYDKKLAATQCDTIRTYPAEMSASDPETLRKVVADAKAQGRKGLVLTCKEHLVHYYAKFGFVSEGVSVSEHGGAKWYQMRLEF